jgi:hypothetical protein
MRPGSPPGPLTLGGYQAHRLLAGALVPGVDAAYGAGDGHAARPLDAPDRHAEVIRLHDDYGTLGPEASVEGVGYLGGEALLKLGTTRVAFHDPGQLREPNHPAIRYVPDVSLAGHWQQVMLAVVCQVATDQERRVRLASERVDRVRLVFRSFATYLEYPGLACLGESGAVLLLTEAVLTVPASLVQAVSDVELAPPAEASVDHLGELSKKGGVRADDDDTRGSLRPTYDSPLRYDLDHLPSPPAGDFLYRGFLDRSVRQRPQSVANGDARLAPPTRFTICLLGTQVE